MDRWLAVLGVVIGMACFATAGSPEEQFAYPLSCQVTWRGDDGAKGDPDAINWAEVPRLGDYWLADGSALAPLKTVTKVAWDADCLYIWRWAEDPDIRATMTERDAEVFLEECLEFFCAPFGDPYQYREINVNPLGAVFDTTIRWPQGPAALPERRDSWNCRDLVCKVRVKGTVEQPDDVDEGWECSMALPFRSLTRYAPKPGVVWRANFYRIERAPKEEYWCWSPTLTNPPSFHVPARFGYLIFTK